MRFLEPSLNRAGVMRLRLTLTAVQRAAKRFRTLEIALQRPVKKKEIAALLPFVYCQYGHGVAILKCDFGGTRPFLLEKTGVRGQW